MLVVLLSLAIINGNKNYLDFWYTGLDLNCRIYSKRSNERPFDIVVYPFWQHVQNKYCKSPTETVIKIDENVGNEKECNQPELRTLEKISI